MGSVSQYWSFSRHVAALTHRTDPWATWTLLAIHAVQVVIAAGVALSQRWLVNATVSSHTLAVVAAVTAGAAGFGAVLVMLRSRDTLRVYLGERVEAQLTAEILTTSANIPTVAHLERPDYLDRLDQLRRGTWLLANTIWSLAGAVATAASLVVSTVLLIRVHPGLSVLGLAALAPFLAGARASKIIRGVEDEIAELVRRERRLHELAVSANSASELRICGSGPIVDGRATDLWKRVSRAQAIARLRGGGWQFAGWSCFAAALIGGVWMVIGMVHAGAATAGDVALTISLATQLQFQIWYVVWCLQRSAAAGHIVGHYNWLRRYATTQRSAGGDEPSERLRSGIELVGVSFGYPGSRSRVLDDVSLWLPAGCVVAIVGLNGAGKSTLVKLLTGMYEPREGVIRIDGKALSELTLSSWRERVSGVFQDHARLALRARETIGVGDLPRIQDRDSVRRAVADADAGPVVAGLPAELETQLGRVFEGVELSLGQWQKLALARAMMREDPLLLVLDEPTAALDAQAEHELYQRFIDRAQRSRSASSAITLLVSHRFSTVRSADLIVVLNDGRVVETGSHTELTAAGGMYAELYQMQAAAFAQAP